MIFAKIGKFLMTPFKFINLSLKKGRGGEYMTYIEGLTVLIVLILCFLDSRPKKLSEFILTVLVWLVISGLIMALSSYVFYFIGSVLAVLTALPAAIYDRCNIFIKYHTPHEADRSSNTAGNGIGTGPKAQVSISYFIERDKRMKVCHAKYLGK